jgi:hypothetical protein
MEKAKEKIKNDLADSLIKELENLKDEHKELKEIKA